MEGVDDKFRNQSPYFPDELSQQDSLRRHNVSVAQKFKPFGCGECDKSYAYASGLIRHVDAVHQKLERFAGCKYN